MKRYLILCFCVLLASECLMAQHRDDKAQAERNLSVYFSAYTSKDNAFSHQPKLEKLDIDAGMRRVIVKVSSSFAQQTFTDKLVGKIYKRVRKALPKSVSKYQISIIANGLPIEDYVPGHALARDNGNALWGTVDYKGEPWVTNVSKPTEPSHGLFGRVVSLWASHGRYYKNDRHRWEWQRPILFGTTEDLFTQTIVVPFLIPMLENAGAIVFTPRERDWQTDEYVVDPDGGLFTKSSDYKEFCDGARWADTPLPGFAAHAGSYADKENPFVAGKARQIKTVKKSGKSFAVWQPTFSKKTRLAVYVSYQTVDNSVDDAHYTVFHQGIATEFIVNQRMGGGTWVYLGTFTFDAGNSIDNSVMLTNQSRRKGVVTADAVRFGGGMGNIERGGVVSGYPRALEGARYAAQWAGAPYTVYGGRGGSDDYADDINTRSLMMNWLSGGSVFNPSQEGKNVPIELSLAVHSDAGYAKDGQSRWGSLAICTTDFNDGQLSSGVTRQTSKFFASELLNGAVRDLGYKYGSWPKRYLWDRNYSETRLPAVPSAILETLSHQNFPDMLCGQDPNFKFDLARSIYKTITRFVNSMHGHPAIIEPLPPQNIAVRLDKDEAVLSWTPQEDQLEPTAQPTHYIIYTAVGSGSFDNGVKVSGTSFSCHLQPGVPYRFRVTAGNRGGESFPSEVVSAVYEPQADKTVLIVNGFHRLSAPAVINENGRQGFDLDDDIGVSYGLTAGWNGRQTNFSTSAMGREGPGGLGYGGNELAGHFIAGNDFNYASIHADAIASAHKYNVVSCSSKAVEIGKVDLKGYDAVDFLLGLERYKPEQLVYYKTFSQAMKEKVSAYQSAGGKVLVSGAYVGVDNDDGPADRSWLGGTLHVSYAGSVKTDSISGVTGMGISSFDFSRSLSSQFYAVQHADKLQPMGDAFCSMQYSDGSPAAVAYNGQRYRTFTMGFPFESITDREMRCNIMRGILSFLFK